MLSTSSFCLNIICFTDFSSLNPSVPYTDEKHISKHAPVSPPYPSPFSEPLAFSSPSTFSDGCPPSYTPTCSPSPPSLHPLQLSVTIAPLQTFVHRPVANIANYQSNLTASAHGYSNGLTGSNLPRPQLLSSRLAQSEHGTDFSSRGLGESAFEFPAVPSAAVL